MALVHRLYFVLLLCGSSISAIAGVIDSNRLSSTFNSSAIRDVSHIPDSASHYKYGKRNTSTLMADIALTASLPISTAQPTSITEQKKEFLARIAGKYRGLGSSIGKLLLQKSVEFNWEKLKVTFQSDYASIEAGQLKVSLQPDSTLIVWRQGI